MISFRRLKPSIRLIIMTFVMALSPSVFLLGCVTFPTAEPTHPGKTSPGAIDWYQGPLNHLSGVRRGPCPMHPSCSEYARQAMAKHGPIKGWVMATDRLMRCGRDETRLAPRVWVNNRVKFYDPLDQNDFWWVENRKSGPLPNSTETPDN